MINVFNEICKWYGSKGKILRKKYYGTFSQCRSQ